MTRRVSLALAAVVVFVLLAATISEAAVVRKEDRRAGVLFRLNGAHLTMKLRDQGNPRTVKRLVGKRVAAACGTNNRTGGTVLQATFTWPRGRSAFAVDFDRDISRRVAYCLVEDARSGGDIALVKFRR